MPDWFNTDRDSLHVGLVNYSFESHTSLTASNYANFDASVANIYVHNATAEFNYTLV